MPYRMLVLAAAMLAGSTAVHAQQMTSPGATPSASANRPPSSSGAATYQTPATTEQPADGGSVDDGSAEAGDDIVTTVEPAQFLEPGPPGLSDELAALPFDELDLDSNGVISEAEAADIDIFTEHRFNSIDTNADGQVDQFEYEEFVHRTTDS